MTASFHANCVTVEDRDDFWLVGFADDEFKTRDYLLLQRGVEDDEQDLVFGMNTYHVERNDQKWSGYGGIESFELHRDRVKICFSKAGGNRMGSVTEMEITFQTDGDEYARLKDRLGRIFGGTDCLV